MKLKYVKSKGKNYGYNNAWNINFNKKIIKDLIELAKINSVVIIIYGVSSVMKEKFYCNPLFSSINFEDKLVSCITMNNIDYFLDLVLDSEFDELLVFDLNYSFNYKTIISEIGTFDSIRLIQNGVSNIIMMISILEGEYELTFNLGKYDFVSMSSKVKDILCSEPNYLDTLNI